MHQNMVIFAWLLKVKRRAMDKLPSYKIMLSIDRDVPIKRKLGFHDPVHVIFHTRLLPVNQARYAGKAKLLMPTVLQAKMLHLRVKPKYRCF